MKSNVRRQAGIVLGMLLALTPASRAQERTAFVCEGRIGNAATSPDAALRGDFEYDIGTNTAAPQQIGQFQWESGYPINFSIIYSAQVRQAFFTLGPTITSQVPAEVFSDANGMGNLNLRVRSVLADSSVWLSNLQLTNAAGVTNLPAMVTSNNNQQLAFVAGQPLPSGFTLTGTAVFEWQSPNIPGRSQLAFQISATEPVLFDLDVDSDNNNGRNPPDLSAAEDAIETNAPGKFVFANVNDDDNDGIPDFADATVAGENNLVPVVLRASPWLDWANTTIRFDYPGPTALDLPAYTGHNLGSGFTNYTGAATNNLPANTTTALRLWNITGPDATKAAASYLVPGRTYTANELGFTGSSTFYMEGVLPGFTNLVATLTQGAAVLSDTVAVTVVYANIGVNNSNNSHDQDPTTRDPLRPGTPDVKFDIDEHDEMLED
jgi:hypothetical protein